MKRVVSVIMMLACLVSFGNTMAAEEKVGPEVVTAWYDEGVAYCRENGLWNRELLDCFDPASYLPKIEFIAMVSRGLGLFDDSGMCSSEAYRAHFASAVAQGLIVAADFPEEKWMWPLERFEAAAVGQKVLETLSPGASQGWERYWDNIPNQTEIPGRYREAVSAICRVGIMTGGDESLSFHGWSPLTRAEGGVLLYRLLQPEARQVPALPAEYGRLLASFTTSFAPGPETEDEETYRENSIYNMLKAGAALNGTSIAPGAVFSFNDTIGNPGRAEGYLQGMIVSGGRKVPGYGGGVCQLSTTLFNAALMANLEIVERHNHGLKSAYVPPGADSAIYWPSQDLRLRNCYSSPLRIVCEGDREAMTLTVRIYSTAETELPDISLSITEDQGVYTLTRYAGGEANYTCTSRYKN